MQEVFLFFCFKMTNIREHLPHVKPVGIHYYKGNMYVHSGSVIPCPKYRRGDKYSWVISFSVLHAAQHGGADMSTQGISDS